ncbi:MAG TPA: LPXTG cell wall anchor domain-containing protein [Pilimelia sp.]|nr:LPXTG cell wall anchor domain-containing protein [Pilimelia sp.]
MYNGVATGSAAGTAAALPLTGVNSVWLALAAFTLISAGVALKRLFPAREG